MRYRPAACNKQTPSPRAEGVIGMHEKGREIVDHATHSLEMSEPELAREHHSPLIRRQGKRRKATESEYKMYDER